MISQNVASCFADAGSLYFARCKYLHSQAGSTLPHGKFQIRLNEKIDSDCGNI